MEAALEGRLGAVMALKLGPDGFARGQRHYQLFLDPAALCRVVGVPQLGAAPRCADR